MAERTSEMTVSNNAEMARYEIEVDGRPAGHAEYRLDGDRVVFTHTEVDDSFEGQGVGSRLAAGALDDVRNSGRRAVPQCPFIAAYIDRHEQYQDLVSQ